MLGTYLTLEVHQYQYFDYVSKHKSFQTFKKHDRNFNDNDKGFVKQNTYIGNV